MKKSSFLEGAMIATIGIVICKIIGLFYVIPFYALVGTQGAALYAYAYNIYKNSNEAYIDFDNHVISLKGSSIERISLKVNKEIFSGMDIIKDELFNRDTKTEAKTKRR